MTLWFRSSEYSNSTYWPKLEVTYSTQGSAVYFLKDHLGSIRATVWDSLGMAVVKGYDDYDPWGYPLAQRTKAYSGLDTTQAKAVARNKFTEKERDEEFGLNLDYFGGRYYDWLRGQWISVDPLAVKYPDFSPYSYVLNNPLLLIDPDGRQVHYSYALRANELLTAQRQGASAAELNQIRQRHRRIDQAAVASVGLIAAGVLAVELWPFYVVNAPRINEYAAVGFEALLPGGESLVSTGAAISAFRGFAESGGFTRLAEKIGIEGLTGLDIQRAFGGLLTRRRGGQEVSIIRDAISDLIGKPGGGTMEGGKFIKFITDNKGNVLIVVLKKTGDDWGEVGSRSLNSSELPFREFGLDASKSFGHPIGQWKDKDGLFDASR
jgi:RHS repeat-associated protein